MSEFDVLLGLAPSQILIGDCRETLRMLPDASVHCCVTSPPYFGLRDYGGQGQQIGRELTPDEFIEALVEVFREVRRVLRDDGSLWINLGDSYSNVGKTGGYTGGKHPKGVHGEASKGCGNRSLERSQNLKSVGFKPKDRMMIPARAALALHADGWFLRDEIVWHKPRTTPAPVKDRTVSAHEMIYLLTKQPRYYYDYLAIEEPSQYGGLIRKRGAAFRNHGDAKAEALASASQDEVSNAHGESFTVRDTRRKRSVWSVSPSPYKEAHFATYPPKLIEPCILAGCPVGGTVLDPFFGAGTTGLVAQQHGRRFIGCELNPDYVEIARRRLGMPAASDDFEGLLAA